MLNHAQKLFVLDTNVILHDSNCIRNFQEHDVAIPITVLEELDKFKRGNEDINFQARQFLRDLDQLTVISCQQQERSWFWQGRGSSDLGCRAG